MDVEKKVCIVVGLAMVAYMLFMYKQMNEFKSCVKNDNEKSQNSILQKLEMIQTNELQSSTQEDSSE